MKLITLSFVVCAFFYSNNSAFASTNRVVKLNVDGMYTETCPVLLKSAVRKIKGVKNIEASLENKNAVIEFDDTITSLKNIQEVIEQQVGFSTELR